MAMTQNRFGVVMPSGKRSSPKVRRYTAKAYPGKGCPTEREESMKLCAWARLMVETNQEPRLKLLRCGFEGLRLGMGLRMQVKRKSICTGWPDFFLAVPGRKEYCEGWLLQHICGLFIELKRRKGGVLSQDQKDMHVLLMQQGYEVAVCKGSDEAIATIKSYLGIK